MAEIDFEKLFENYSEKNRKDIPYEKSESDKILDAYYSIREILDKRSKKHQKLDKMYKKYIQGKVSECYEDFVHSIYMAKRRELDDITPEYKALNDFFENYLNFYYGYSKEALIGGYDITEEQYKEWFK